MKLETDSPEFQRIWAKVVARSWMEPDFKKRLLAEPEAVLGEYGVEVPPGTPLDIEDASEAPAGTPPRPGPPQEPFVAADATSDESSGTGSSAPEEEPPEPRPKENAMPENPQQGQAALTAGTVGCPCTGTATFQIPVPPGGASRSLGGQPVAGGVTLGTGGSAGSAGTICGTAGTIGTAGTAGTAGAAPGAMPPCVASVGTIATAGTQGTLATAQSAQQGISCVGSAGSVGCVGSVTGTIGTAGSGGTFGSGGG